MLNGIFGKINVNKRDFLVIILLFVSVFGWYYMARSILTNFLELTSATYEENLAVWVVFNFSIIGSSIIGATLSSRLNNNKFLYGWTLFGVIVSLLPMMYYSLTFIHIFVFALLLGISFGLGMPYCLKHFADSTTVENRGRIGGVSFLVANASVPLLGLVVQTGDWIIISLGFSLVRAIGLIFVFSRPQKNIVETKVTESFLSILSDKSFFLYFIVWFLFPLVDRFESSLIVSQVSSNLMEDLLFTMNMVEPLVAAVTILVAGVLCDYIGRKKVLLFGFASLGFAYAILGFFSESLSNLSLVWYFYFIIDAIAWGIFLLIFVLIIWGDLSKHGSRTKYYAIGSIPFFLSYIIPQMLTPSMIENIVLDTAFSMAALFLFVAFLPLVFAPETLPEKKMELRRLKSFAEQAKKEREKFEQKN